jgi:hypothetical protein
MSDLRKPLSRGKTIQLRELADEVIKLLQMRMDELYGTLGGQLMGTLRPTQAAGIVSFLFTAESAAKAKTLLSSLPSVTVSPEWNEGVEVICDEFTREGRNYIEKIREELCATLNDNNEQIFQLSEQRDRPSIHAIVMVIAAILKLPRELEPLSATVTAILLKQGLRDFCSGYKNTTS